MANAPLSQRLVTVAYNLAISTYAFVRIMLPAALREGWGSRAVAETPLPGQVPAEAKPAARPAPSSTRPIVEHRCAPNTWSAAIGGYICAECGRVPAHDWYAAWKAAQ